MAFVQAVVQTYQQRGLSPASALATAQIAPEAVQHQHARITALQMELLCAHAMRELDDEALGWFSRRLPWAATGMLARASISSPNLGLAMARWCRHHNLLTDDIALQLHHDGPQARIELRTLRTLGAMQGLPAVGAAQPARTGQLVGGPPDSFAAGAFSLSLPRPMRRCMRCCSRPRWCLLPR